VALNSGSLALCRRAISIAVRKHCSASALSVGIEIAHQLRRAFYVGEQRGDGLALAFE
jgi:hypothetical protein